MKKIIWIFGESATGKKTLIEYLMSHSDSDLAIRLGLENEKMKVVEETIAKNLSSVDDEDNERNRSIKIINGIMDFMDEDDASVLLVKGQANDMSERFGNTLKKSALMFPEADKEILLLDVPDHDILYSRFVNKDWFQADKEEYSKMFSREWLDRAVEKHRNRVYSYEPLGYRITEIDSTNDYKVVNNVDLGTYRHR